MDAYPEVQPNPRADGGSVGDAFIWEMIGSRYTISPADKVLLLRSAADCERHKSGLSVWLENLEEASDDVAEQPPAYIVYYRDTIHDGQPKQGGPHCLKAHDRHSAKATVANRTNLDDHARRSAPFNLVFLRGGGDGKGWYLTILKWLIGPPFKECLKEYSSQNAGEVAALCANEKPEKDKAFFRRNADEIAALCADIKVDQVRLGVACENNAMLAAALLVVVSILRVATEEPIVRPLLTDEDMSLSRKIEQRAIHVIQLACEYSTAAAALVCIVKETELLFDLFEHEIDFPKMITLSKMVRQYAFMLMLYKGPESAAITGALVGMAKEARFMTYLLSGDNPAICMDFDMCDTFRGKASIVLARLLEEFLCKTPDNGDGNGTPASANSEKPIGRAACHLDNTTKVLVPLE
ncbi:hypothetical protein ACP70R_033899 [Stipagrostis hirtigluma subsp. patula]